MSGAILTVVFGLPINDKVRECLASHEDAEQEDSKNIAIGLGFTTLYNAHGRDEYKDILVPETPSPPKLSVLKPIDNRALYFALLTLLLVIGAVSFLAHVL